MTDLPLIIEAAINGGRGNAELVREIAELARGLGRPVASAVQARSLLGVGERRQPAAA